MDFARRSALVAGVFFIVLGAISLLSIVTLRQDTAGAADANAASLVAVGRSLVAMHDWTFLFGPNLALGIKPSPFTSGDTGVGGGSTAPAVAAG